MATLAIWNDIYFKTCKLIDWQTFKEQDFVVFRRLYVVSKQIQVSLSHSELIREFDIVGPIECVEIKQSQPCDLQKQTEYAYITYLDCLSAYTAVGRFSNAKHGKYIVQPADTWHQPIHHDDSQYEAQDHKNTILQLNDDCLSNIFNYCDIESLSNAYDACSLFRKLAEQQKLRRKWQNILFDIRSNSSLRRFRQILRYIGSEIHEFTLQLHSSRKPENLHRFLYKIAQYLKGKIENLTILYITLEIDVLNLLKPLLSNIKLLRLQCDNYDFDFDINLRSICVNLTNLKLSGNLIFVLNSGPWARLHKLSIHNNQFMEGPTFDHFCKGNQQLKKLSIQSDDSNQIFQSVNKYLRTIEKLSIHNGYPSTNAASLHFLTDLEHLTILKLTYLESEYLNDILNLVCNLKRLTHLKIHFLSDEDEFLVTENHIADMANHLTMLKILHLGQFSISEGQLLNLIESMPSLNELGITFDDVIDVDLQEKLNAARSLAGTSEILTIIKNPFEKRGPKHCKELASLQFIKIKKYYPGDQSIKFNF